MSQLPKLDRRAFMRLAVGAAALSTGCFISPRWAKSRSSHWAFFSDVHIRDIDDSAKTPKGCFYYDPYRHLSQAVHQALDSQPEGVIITGDLARLQGHLEDYKKLSEILKPLGALPVYAAMGNHDDRDHWAQVFNTPPRVAEPVPHKHVQVIERGPVRLILLDSNKVVNQSHGLLGPAQLEWLGQFLRRSDNKPTLLCVHHVPTRLDEFEDVTRLFELVRPIAKVKAIIYGHSHEYTFAEQDGIHLVNLPATAYSFKKEHAIGWVEANFTREGGAFTMYVIDGPRTEDGKTHELKWRTTAPKTTEKREAALATC